MAAIYPPTRRRPRQQSTGFSLVFAAFAVGGVLAFAAAGPVAAGAAPTAKTVAATQTLTLYAQVTKEQFVNNRDDRARGLGNNPFGNSAGTGTSLTNERKSGPLPGDEGLFEFALYKSANLQGRVGTGAFVCQYVFAKLGTCDVSYTLGQGSLIGVGTFAALTTNPFSFVITGGTGSYRGFKGTLNVAKDPSTNAPGSQTVTHTVPALVLEAQRVTVSVGPAASSAPSTSTLYSVAKEEQFIDNDDDEARGFTSNPFGMRDPQVEKASNGAGPYPGDESLFSFAVYSTAKLQHSTVTGTYTCNYYFNKNAFCDASYRFATGTVFAAGAFNFNAKSYSLAITGGTGKYQAATGEIDSAPGQNQAQRLTVHLGGS